MELGGTRGWRWSHEMMIMMMVKCSSLGKEEREKQNWLKAKVYLTGAFCFGDQNTIESVITFRIDGHTIKRGALIGQLDHLVPLGVGILAFAFKA
jgi:hypothetical protein